MDIRTQKVLQRLAYEKLLVTDLFPKRYRITLEDALHAAQYEARVLFAIPATILYKKKIFTRLDRQLKEHKEWQDFIKNLFQRNPNETFMNLPVAEFQKVAFRYQKYLEISQEQNKAITRTFRFSENDESALEKLTNFLNKPSKSETLRYLIQKEMRQLGVSS